MGHQPTIFYILENETLGTWWVGKMKSTLDGCGMPPYRSITQDELNEKLSEKYHYPNAYLTLVTLNKRWTACYGVERWLSKLEYKISKEPEKYKELEELLKAGWDGEMETSTLSVFHVLEYNQPIDKIFKKLVTSREGLTRCLNTNKYKTYEDKKKDPDFLKAIGRKKVLRQMEKTGKLPKPETLAKYEIKDEEIKERMEEVLCEPCEKEFYRKGNRWYCLCDKRVSRCSNSDCKILGAKLSIIVGASVCEHNKIRSRCKKCDGGEICKHNKRRSICKKCDGGEICKHNKRRSECRPCGGKSICEHNRRRFQCKECEGVSICEHNRQRSSCKKCGGVSICEHNINRGGCRRCMGSQVCKHNRTRSVCKECDGGAVCEHKKERSSCKICDPQSYIARLRRCRRRQIINSPNPTHTLDDLCMTSEEWLKYLHKTFEDRYGRSKTEEDEVHIDEIIPCSAWNLPDDNKYCWHYLNSQWLLAEDNMSKHDSYEEGDKLAMIERIQSSINSSSSESA